MNNLSTHHIKSSYGRATVSEQYLNLSFYLLFLYNHCNLQIKKKLYNITINKWKEAKGMKAKIIAIKNITDNTLERN